MTTGCDFENGSSEGRLRDDTATEMMPWRAASAGGTSVEGSVSGGAIQAPGTPSAETEPMPTNSRAARTTTAAVQATTPTPAERSQPSR